MVKWREQLRPILREWSSVQMVTLTVDPAKFEGPQAAWEYVGQKRMISRLVRTLKRVKHDRGRRKGQSVLHGPEWVCALEFHKSGWPHWHLVLHSSFVPVDRIRAAWGLGHVSISRSRGFESPDHAVHYVTKYISKFDHIPEWALDYSGNLRRFSCSRGLVGKPRKRSESKGGDRFRRPIRERMADCGRGEKVLLRVPVVGGHRYWYVRTEAGDPVEEACDANGDADRTGA